MLMRGNLSKLGVHAGHTCWRPANRSGPFLGAGPLRLAGVPQISRCGQWRVVAATCSSEGRPAPNPSASHPRLVCLQHHRWVRIRMASAIEDEFWIFGYGLTSPDNHNLPEMLTKDRSLIWKPPPHYGTLPHQPDEEEYIDDLAD